MADSVKIKITGDDSGFKKTLSGLGNVAKSAFSGVAVGAGAAAAAIGGVAIKSMNMAGELEQNLGGSEAVFENYAGQIQSVADTAFSNMGLSASDFLATANKMGALFKGSGFEIQESANMTAQAMQRAADIASIMGIDVGFAMESIAGAAKGNFTMMDNLGVAMNDTTLNAYALEIGLGKTTRQMTNQEKVALAMQMFLDKTSYAAGNYAKENDTLAGSLTTAKAALDNFLSGAGDFDAVFDSFMKTGEIVGRMMGDIITRITSELTDNAPRIGEALGRMFSSGAKQAPGIINAAFTMLNAFIDAIGDNSEQIGTGIQDVFYEAVNGISDTLPNLADAGAKLINSLIPDDPADLTDSVYKLLTGISSSIETLATGIDWGTASGTIIGGLFAGILKALPDVITDLSNAIIGFDMSGFGQAYVSAFEKVDWVNVGKRAGLSILSGILSGIVLHSGKNSAIGKFLTPLIEKINSKNEELKRAGEENGKSYTEGFNNGVEEPDVDTPTQKGVDKAVETSTEGGQEVKESFIDNANATGETVDLNTPVEKGANEAKSTAESGGNEAGSGFIMSFEASVNGKPVTIDLQINPGNATSEGENVGSEVVEGTSGGIESGTSTVSGAMSATVQAAITDGKTAAQGASAVGTSMSEGVARGIKSGQSDVVQAAVSVVKAAISAAEKEADINSPSKETRDRVGKPLSEGVAVGILKNKKSVVKASENVANSSISAFKSTLDIHSPSGVARDEIGAMIDRGIAVGIRDNRSYIMNAFEENNESIIEFEQKRLEEIEEINAEYADDEVTRKEKLNEKLSELDKEYADLSVDMLENVTEAVKDEKERVIEELEDLVSQYGDKIDEVIAEQDSFADKLKNSGDLYYKSTLKLGENDVEFFHLQDLSGNVKVLEEYYNTLSKARQRLLNSGLSEDDAQAFFNEKLRELDIYEATGFAKAITTAGEEKFNTYIDNWVKSNSLADKIAEDFYTSDRNKIAKALKEEFGQVPEEMFNIGVESQALFGKGFLRDLQLTLDEAKSLLTSTLSTKLIGLSIGPPSTGDTITTFKNYYLQPSSGESTQAQLQATKNADILEEMRGGY